MSIPLNQGLYQAHDLEIILTKQRVHFETSVMLGASFEPMLISSHSSSANGPPPLSTILGRNLPRALA
jgi:hypothetical protein